MNFPTVGMETPLLIPARLDVPLGVTEKVPAVVIAHSTAGVDKRGHEYAAELNAAGIATLEIDMWSPRGMTGGAEGRPRTVGETLPDVYGALKYLSAQPTIDATRIGIMGFSWGGVLSMLSATREATDRVSEGLRFAAHAPFYPVCWVYNKVPGYGFSGLTGAPVFIQAGEADDYDNPDSCQKLLESLTPEDRAHVELVVYPGATHGWDRLERPAQSTDPFAHLGQGGPVDFEPSYETTRKSRAAVVTFFQRSFGMTP